MKTLYIDKDKIDSMIRALADQVRQAGDWSGRQFEQVVGIERGGLNVSRPLAKMLHLPHDSVYISCYTESGRREVPIIKGDYNEDLVTLVVDDLIDGGTTIELFKDCYDFKSEDGVAVLFWNTKSPKPDFYAGIKPKPWLEFYWERKVNEN